MSKNSRRKKMRDSWGSIDYDPKRRVGHIRFWASLDERGYRRHCVTVRGTRQDVEDRRAELMLAHSQEAPCPTVGELWERWYLHSMERRVEAGDLAPKTLDQYKSAWRRHVEPRWGQASCDAVRPLEVQQWLDTLGKSAATGSMDVLRPLMDYAVRYGIASSNPFREKYVMPATKSVQRKDKGIWTLEELGEVWRDAALNQWWEAAFLLSAFGGLRVGESLGVRSEDVTDIGGACAVSVRRQVLNNGSLSDTLKNQQGYRTVAIPGKAGARLLGLADVAVNGWLTGDGLGGHCAQRRLNKAWREAGTEHPFRNLRNSWQTNMRWSLKVQPYFIETMMGHLTAGVTGQYYDRPTPEMLARVIADAYAANRYDEGWNWVN